MDFILSKFAAKIRQDKLLAAVYVSNIFFAFHYYLLIYINSSFLAKFFSDSQLSVLYIIGSLCSLLVLINISRIIKEIGTYHLLAYLVCIEILATLGMAFSQNATLIGLYFIVYQMSTPLIYFGMDVFLEGTARGEDTTGEIRTGFLALENFCLILTTLLVSWLARNGGYSSIYVVSSLFLIPLFVMLKTYFRNFTDSTLPTVKIRQTLQTYIKNKDLYNVFTAHTFLQIFFAFMTIYSPIYLFQYMGFSWTEIGLMLGIALLPFVLFELPIGWLADKKYGEKEMMTIGFVVMGLFCMGISFMTTKSFVFWTALLFMTRVGAAMVEATTDSYFFKKVDKNNTDIIGFYRIGRPSSYIIAPILATLSLTFLSFNNLFLVLGIIMIFGCHYSLSITDTR